MTARPRCLLDTEAVLRAWRDDGPARELLQLGMVRDIALCTSTTVLDEVDAVLARPKFRATALQRQALRRTMLVAADEVAVLDAADAPRRSPDPGDDHVVESALRTRTDLVVSANVRDLLVPGCGYRVLEAGPACRHVREGGPYGRTDRLDSSQQRRQEAELALLGGGERRLGADDRLRTLTGDLAFEPIAASIRVAPLSPSGTVELAAEAVRRAGTGLAFDARSGVRFDFVSGTWTDVPGRAGTVPLDLVWYSSDRAAAEAIEDPGSPTIADLGFADESRYRLLLAGGMVVLIDRPGPFGEPDVRALVLVAEPLLPVPPTATPFRVVASGGGLISSRTRDPAGFVADLSVSHRGGPEGVLSATPLGHRDLGTVFGIADDVAATLGWPSHPTGR